jgi:hypothetical protein
LAEVVLGRGALLLDSGGISAIAAGNTLARAVLARARNEGRQVAIPAAVLAETITDRPEHAIINRVVNKVDFEIPLSAERGREAGILRARAAAIRHKEGAKHLPPSAVDASVMAEAAALGAAIILTSDPRDMELLRDAAGLTAHDVEIIAV